MNKPNFLDKSPNKFLNYFHVLPGLEPGMPAEDITPWLLLSSAAP